MANIFNRTFYILNSYILMVAIFIACMTVSGASYAVDIWSVLERDGNELDLMALESVGHNTLLVSAKYDQRHWQAEQPAAGQMLTSGPAKHLHIMSFNSKESINWRRSYPALPEVNEIYSVSATSNDHLCIAYGRPYHDREFINPVVVQVGPNGKIIWANTSAIPQSSIESSSSTLVQMANLDSINIVDSADNGCALAYILRLQTAESESFQIHLVNFDSSGNLQWRASQDTDLYGRMFLTRDKQQNHFAIVQTNQSRDAAIAAMMAARPFSPHTSMIVFSSKGELLKHHKKLETLSKVWVKHIVDAPGDLILLAGRSKTAWIGFLDTQGKVSGVNNSMEGEFSYVNHQFSTGFLLVQNASLVSMGDQLKARISKPISRIVKKKYSNALLAAKLPEQVPIQNIVPLGNQNYLILYKLGSKLLKVDLRD